MIDCYPLGGVLGNDFHNCNDKLSISSWHRYKRYIQITEELWGKIHTYTLSMTFS